MSALVEKQAFDLTPRSLDEVMKFAELMASSSIVPKEFIGKPGNILVAIQWGMELGLKPMQAMQNIAVINGRPSLWGDAVIALVRASPLCEYVNESLDNGMAVCRVKRVGEAEQMRTFSAADAQRAGLSSKPGPWSQYPNRMMQMRARAFALRDVFPDVLRGMPIAEEVMDSPVEKTGASRYVSPAEIVSNTTLLHQRTEQHVHLIKRLEEVARTGGYEALAACWSGKLVLAGGETLTLEDRKAIGTQELERLKEIAKENAPLTLPEGDSHE